MERFRWVWRLLAMPKLRIRSVLHHLHFQFPLCSWKLAITCLWNHLMQAAIAINRWRSNLTSEWGFFSFSILCLFSLVLFGWVVLGCRVWNAEVSNVEECMYLALDVWGFEDWWSVFFTLKWFTRSFSLVMVSVSPALEIGIAGVRLEVRSNCLRISCKIPIFLGLAHCLRV